MLCAGAQGADFILLPACLPQLCHSISWGPFAIMPHAAFRPLTALRSAKRDFFQHDPSRESGHPMPRTENTIYTQQYAPMVSYALPVRPGCQESPCHSCMCPRLIRDPKTSGNTNPPAKWIPGAFRNLRPPRALRLYIHGMPDDLLNHAQRLEVACESGRLT
mgnify:CR=1 FL=1